MLSPGAAPSSWQLASGAVVAAGTLSAGNALGVSDIQSDTSYCLAVNPTYDGARAWRATQDGLAVGDC